MPYPNLTSNIQTSSTRVLTLYFLYILLEGWVEMRLAGKAPSPLWNGVAQGYRWVDGGLSLVDRGMMDCKL